MITTKSQIIFENDTFQVSTRMFRGVKMYSGHTKNHGSYGMTVTGKANGMNDEQIIEEVLNRLDADYDARKDAVDLTSRIALAEQIAMA